MSGQSSGPGEERITPDEDTQLSAEESMRLAPVAQLEQPGLVQANYIVEGTTESDDELPSTSARARRDHVHQEPSSVKQPGVTHIHYTKITANIVSTGANAYIEQTGGTNIVGAVTSKEGQESKQDSQASKEVKDKDLVELADGYFMYSCKSLRKRTKVFKGFQKYASGIKIPRAIKMIAHCEEKNLREVKHLVKLSYHPNIVRIIHSIERHFATRTLFIVMELCSSQNLQDYVDENCKKESPFNFQLTMSYTKQLFAGVIFVHENGIIHRDLKPENVLFSLDGKVIKLSDFGISKELQKGRFETNITSSNVGTDGYRAPETYNSDTISQLSDMYSLGLTTHVLWTNGKHPFGQDPDDWNSNIKRNKNRYLFGLLIPFEMQATEQEYLKLIDWLLKFKPQDRPTAEEAFQHNFFISVHKVLKVYLVLELRVLTRPNSRDIIVATPPLKQVMMKTKKGCNYLVCQLAAPYGSVLKYFYLRNDGEQDLSEPRHYSVGNADEGQEVVKTRIKYDVAFWDNVKDPISPHEFLPKPEDLEVFGRDNLMREIDEWITEWKSHNKRAELENSLEKWTEKILLKSEVCTTKILIACAIVTALFDAESAIENCNLLANLCHLLHIVKDDEHTIARIYHDVLQYFSKRKKSEHLSLSMTELLCNATMPKNLFLALPFHWLLQSEGKLMEMDEYMTASAEQTYYLPGNRCKLWTERAIQWSDKTAQKDLWSFKPRIMTLSKDFPWILKPYLYFFTGDSLASFLKEEMYSSHSLGIFFLHQKLSAKLLLMEDRKELEKMLGMLMAALSDQRRSLTDNILREITHQLRFLLEDVTAHHKEKKDAILLYCARALNQIIDGHSATPGAAKQDGVSLDLEKEIAMIDTLICNRIQIALESACHEQVDLLNNFLQIDWKGHAVARNWVGKIRQGLESQSNNLEFNLVQFYIAEIMENKKYLPDLKTLYKNAAVCWFTNYLDAEKDDNPWKKLKDDCSDCPGQILDFYREYLTERLRKEDSIDFLLEWKYAVQGLELFCDGGKFNAKAEWELSKQVGNFESFVKGVFDGSMSYKDFQKIQQKKQRCINLWACIKGQAEDIKNRIEQCENVLQQHDNMRKGFQIFVENCQNLSADQKIDTVEPKERVAAVITEKTISEIKVIFRDLIQEEGILFWTGHVVLQGNVSYVKKVQDMFKTRMRGNEMSWRDAVREIFLPAQSWLQTMSHQTKEEQKIVEDEDWLYAAVELLRAFYNELKAKVRFIWPKDPELVDRDTWPISLFAIAGEEREKENMKTFVAFVKRQAKTWMNKNLQRLKQDEKIIQPLVQEIWPNEPRLLRRWPINTLTKSMKLEDPNAIKFMVAAKQLFSAQESISSEMKANSEIAQMVVQQQDNAVKPANDLQGIGITEPALAQSRNENLSEDSKTSTSGVAGSVDRGPEDPKADEGVIEWPKEPEWELEMPKDDLYSDGGLIEWLKDSSSELKRRKDDLCSTVNNLLPEDETIGNDPDFPKQLIKHLQMQDSAEVNRIVLPIQKRLKSISSEMKANSEIAQAVVQQEDNAVKPASDLQEIGITEPGLAQSRNEHLSEDSKTSTSGMAGSVDRGLEDRKDSEGLIEWPKESESELMSRKDDHYPNVKQRLPEDKTTGDPAQFPKKTKLFQKQVSFLGLFKEKKDAATTSSAITTAQIESSGKTFQRTEDDSMEVDGGKYEGVAWQNLNKCVEAFRPLANGIIDESIKYRDFKEIYDEKQRSIDLWKRIERQPENFEICFKTACETVDYYNSMKKSLQCFVKECSCLVANHRRQIPTEKTRINVTKLNERIKVAINEKSIANIKTIFSDLVRTEGNLFWIRIVKLQNNDYYIEKTRDLFEKLLKKTRDISWSLAVTDIFAPAQEGAEKISKDIEEGTLRLKHIPDIFKQHSDPGYVTKQLQQLYDIIPNRANFQTRLTQISEYYKIKTAMDTKKLLLEIKDVLKLDGDFSALSGFDKNWPEADLNHSPRVSGDTRSYKAEELAVLERFLEQKTLLSWLRVETKTIKDIITFEELAKSTAKDDIELDKILALRIAVEGFSPLIYDLRGTSDTKRLQAACETVLRNCSQDNKLLENWEISGSEVTWFKRIVEIFGETGKHSMTTVQEINDDGSYIIKRGSEKVFTLDNYIKLKNRGEVKTHSALRDLQSHIMLITGEKHGKDQAKQVDAFVTLLSAVENLAQVCMDLSKAGCLLFEDLLVTLQRRPENVVPATPAYTITFRLNEKTLTGTGNITTIHEIIGSMRIILSKWQDYLNKAYSKYYYLNEFSNDQITYLCKELGEEKITRLPDQVKILLGKIRPDIAWGKINVLIDEATQASTVECDLVSESQDEAEVSEIAVMNRVVRTLHFDRGIKENVAKAAVVASKVLDVAKCAKWAYLHENNEELVQKFLLEFENKTADSYKGRNLEANLNILNAKVNKTMDDILVSLLERGNRTSEFNTSDILTLYEAFVKEAGSLTMEGLLNIEHFGKFLMLVAKEGGGNKPPERVLTPKLQKGKPNIIICDEPGIPTAALHLYAHQKEYPLPTASEVLLCHENTSECEVSRFFRRALFYCPTNGSPIFCLASAHKLRHQISESAANLFHELTRGNANIDREYQLVIISANRDHVLSTFLDHQEYHAVPDGFSDKMVLSSYLKEKLKSTSGIHESIVKVVYSQRSGLGKSLHIERLKEKAKKELGNQLGRITTIRYMEKVAEPDLFLDKLTGPNVISNEGCHFIHLDMTPAIQDGLLHFGFNLFILGSIEDSKGRVWRRGNNHLYVVELTLTNNERTADAIDFLQLLPNMRCPSPREILEIPREILEDMGIAIDEFELQSEGFRRVSMYLKKFDENPRSISKSKFLPDTEQQLNQRDCLDILLKHCSVVDPSWSQLHHFVTFLNVQLKKWESSKFCDEEITKELGGLTMLVIRFMINMAQDFSTPSIDIEDISARDIHSLSADGDRRSWQKRSIGPGEKYPLVCFNRDGSSLTFIDVHIDEKGNVVNAFNEILIKDVVPSWSKNLPSQLEKHGIAINENFHELTRKEKLRVLYKIMGVPLLTERTISGNWMECLQRINAQDGRMPTWFNAKDSIQLVSADHLPILRHCQKCNAIVHGNKFEELEKMLNQIAAHAKDYKLKLKETVVCDPDPTFELSTNNVLKILAIYMRFSCNIPVIIMGETGCGKTRMIKFLSDLLKGKSDEENGNLMTLRVHGGITVEDIHKHIEKAKTKTAVFATRPETFLFFDEANTTEAIYAIKEAICDRHSNCSNEGLWIVAACNPYKKLSNRAIDKLSKSGLGYRTRARDSNSNSIQMHSLVYRVISLPPSMKPFVWDFRQLGDYEEQLYIRQMVFKLKSENKLGFNLKSGAWNEVTFLAEMVSDIFSHAQQFMRKQIDECRYVSLRDVERCITAYKWFHTNQGWIFPEIERKTKKKYSLTIHIVLQVLGLCYHASLENRKKFREEIAKFFQNRIRNFENFTAADFLEELEACQEFIVSHMDYGEDIVINEALRENVYMIALCAEMKIPLFLIGKPGSSKSLAKAIVTESLLGDGSKNEKCRNFKAIVMSSFQCSALTKEEELRRVFEQSSKYQSKKDQERYVSVVALDEIGLAEDSPHMPLKILHALLESGSAIDDDIGCESNKSKTDSEKDANDSPHMPVKRPPTFSKSQSLTDETLKKEHNASRKLGFLGISNWALDPAKMNRGIFVTRGAPDQNQLFHTTKELLVSGEKAFDSSHSSIEQVLRALIRAYLEVLKKSKSEYFGLRDLYSMVKMIKHSLLKDSKQTPVLTLDQAMNAVFTNFSGGNESHEEIFRMELNDSRQFQDEFHRKKNPYVVPTISEIIDSNLNSQGRRHLLLLTRQFFPLNMLTCALKSKENKLQVIYGSAFPGDDNYTALCRNVNKIKVCMETDCIAIILNLRKIHESLYDTLNQHYVTFGDTKYVDLGFSSSEHRIKCRVHENFRMIFVEDTDIVYEEYPAPLINRLEKHHFCSERLLTPVQAQEATLLKRWMSDFATLDCFDATDAFTGHHDNFAETVILVHGHETEDVSPQRVRDSKNAYSINDPLMNKLLQCATVDSIFRLLSQNSKLSSKADAIHEAYFKHQRHENLLDFLRAQLKGDNKSPKIYDVSTFSSVLMENDRREMEKSLFPGSNGCVALISLRSCETLQQFSDTIDRFFAKGTKENAKLREDNLNQEPTKYRKILLIQCNFAHKNRDLVACARYCLESKLRDNNGNESKPICAFLLSTNRQYSENSLKDTLQLQPTTNGDIVYIDELRPKNQIGPLADYWQCSVGKIFFKGFENYSDMQSSGSEFSAKALDILRLLKSCFCEALSQLKSSGPRDVDRLAILENKMDDKNFTRVLLKKIVDLSMDKSLGIKGFETPWIVNEACDRVKLLEAGTFQKAIWLSLKKKISAVFAYIISIIDGNSNLDLVSTKEGTSWSPALWMKMFEKMLFQGSFVRYDKEYDVGYCETADGKSLSFPFSFLLYEKFTRMWEASDQDGADIFMTSLSDLDIWPPVDQFFKSNGSEVLEVLISDITRMAYKPRSSDKETEVNTILCIVKTWVTGCEESQVNSQESNDEKSQLAVSIAKFFRIRKYFEMLSRIFENWPEMTDFSKFEVPKFKSEMDILHKVFADLVKILTSKISDLKTAENCLEWMDKVFNAEQIFGSFNQETTLKSNKWTLISLLHLLFTQLTPTNSTKNDQEYRSYLQIVAKEAENLGVLFAEEPWTIGDHEGVIMVCKRLAKCFLHLKSRLLVNWADPRCHMCARPMEEPRQLECGHYVCKTCVCTLSLPTCSQPACFQCRKKLEENLKDLIDSEPVLSSTCIEKLNDFKMKCTSFFLNYMTRFVNDERAYDLILKEVLLYDVSTSPENNGESTQIRSLDISALDINIMTKSYLLKYLLGNYRVDTVVHLNSHIGRAFDTGNNLISAIILHFESSLDPSNETIENTFAKMRRCDKLSLQMLEYVAKMRHELEVIVTTINGEGQRAGGIVKIPKALKVFEIDAKDVLRLYFIKYGINRFGVNWIAALKDRHLSSKLLRLSSSESIRVIDLWQMLGEEYSLESIQRPEIRFDPSILDYSQTTFGVKTLTPLFASFSLTMKSRKFEPRFFGSLNGCTVSQSPLASDVSLSMQLYRSKFVNRDPTDRPLIQLLVLAAIAIRKQTYLMNEFKNILESTEKIDDLFLPTMPESLYFSVPKEFRTKHRNWYGDMVTNMFACPNGHMYMIDNCTRPQERATCPVCKANIGGENNNLDPENTRFEEDEKSQMGYILDKASSPQYHNDNPDDRMSKHGVAVTRFILHSTLLLAVGSDRENFSNITQVEGKTQEEFLMYLVEQLRKCIGDLASALQKNKDDAYIITYKILEYIINTEVQSVDTEQPYTWSTIESRREWERRFREVFLLPIFENIDDVLANGWNMMSETGELDRLRRDLPLQAQQSTETWSHPILWRTLRHLDIKTLLQHIKDSQKSSECEVLQAILARPNLDSTRFIKPVLQLQAALIRRYQNKKELAETEKISFLEFLTDDETKRELVVQYFEAWKTTQAHKQLSDDCQELSMDSPISFALPNKRGHGKSAMLLSMTLVEMHNEFLGKCATMLPELKLEEVSVSDLQEPHIVYSDIKSDLLELIKMHTKYDIHYDETTGSKHQFVHDFQALENLVRETYVRHKKIIKIKTIPSIQYSQDASVSEVLPKLKKLIGQESLSVGLERSVDSKISEYPPAELYEGVRTLSHAIRFLVKFQTPLERDKGLRQYMKKTLLMDEQLSVIPVAAGIKHAMGLYQHLTWHKAVAFARQGIDPYQAISDGQTEISSDLRQKVNSAFKGTSAVKLQRRINEILITMPDCKASWSLTEDIFPYAPYLDEDGDQSWFQNLPKELKFCHISHLFRLTVEFVNRVETTEFVNWEQARV